MKATSNPQSDVYIGAYKGDNTLVITAINMSNSDNEQQFVLKNGDRTISSFVPYITSSTMNLSKKKPVSVSDEDLSFSYNIPARSIITFVEE